MAKLFSYTGRNSAGSSVSGTIEAANSTAVAEQLFKQNITPIAIVASSKK